MIGTVKMAIRELEATWLRLRIIRLRAALRYALDPRVEAILRETVADMEERLEQLEDSSCARPRPEKQLPQSS